MKHLPEHGLALMVTVVLVAAAWGGVRWVDEVSRPVTIPFGGGTAVSGDGRVAMERVVWILRGDLSAVAEVSGHVWPGNDVDADRNLAMQRARHVVDGLIAAGVGDDKAVVAVDGHARPLPGGCDASWSDRECRVKHARAEVVIKRGR